jgi:hypothetical protein
MTAVEICNLALSHLGDTASVSAIDPPEASVQAELCSRFYPIARDTVLQSHPWSFITRRADLVLTAEVNDQWEYVYALPNNLIEIIAILDPNTDHDYSITYETSENLGAFPDGVGAYAPRPYAIETLAAGTRVICTNQVDAVARYTQYITDTTLFPPMFAMALTWLLASMLAGPLIKGDVGAAEGKRCYQMFQVHHQSAMAHDSKQRKTGMNHFVSWISGR